MALRVGLVGAGPWAREAHAPALKAHPQIDFVGGWARNPAAAAELHPRSFASPAELFDAVDAVAFAVPPSVQAPLAADAARAGKHLILDKPIALDLSAAAELAGVVADSGVRSIVVFTRRFAPETRAFVTEARSINPTAVEAQWLSGSTLGGKFASSQWRQEQGALLDVGPHILDLVDAVCGPVAGVDGARYHAPTDTWTVQLAHADGAASSVSLSLRTPAVPTIMRVCAHSADGVALLDSRRTPTLECFRVLLDEFIESVETGVDHPLGAARGLAIQRIIASIQEHAGSKQAPRSPIASDDVGTLVQVSTPEPSHRPPSYEDVTGYTESGVPTFDHVRENIERRAATALGAEELAHGTAAGQDAERAFADRKEAAKAKLEEIRRSMGNSTPDQ